MLRDDAELQRKLAPGLFDGVYTIKVRQPGASNPVITAIPYYAWAHCGVGEMTVWFTRKDA